jgi:hypothetical protein
VSVPRVQAADDDATCGADAPYAVVFRHSPSIQHRPDARLAMP